MSKPGTRNLTILGEFKPFGLIAEQLDGKPIISNNTYTYSLFSPRITREAHDQSDDGQDYGLSADDSCNRSDHELFIRGNRIIWSSGSRILKRFTLPSPVIKACWCRLGAFSEPNLFVLQFDALTMYKTSGETVCIPLSHAITSIWPLPVGLLLQKANEVSHPPHILFPPPNPFLDLRDLSRHKREVGHSPPQHHFGSLSTNDHSGLGNVNKLSSHLILRDPIEGPQVIYVGERGQLSPMKDYDEVTIWTSNLLPLMVSYNKGMMQHTVWLIENAHFNLEDASKLVPVGDLSKQFSFRKIWHKKGSKSAASKVFLANDIDGMPLICFLLQEQKGLFFLKLQTIEINNETSSDIKPDISWSMPAMAAAPVTVTRPSIKVGLLPFVDIIVLGSENKLSLYSGRQCLCRYLIPSDITKGMVSYKGESSTASGNEFKITGLANEVDERINVTFNNNLVLRCALRRSPSSSLVNDCVTAMAEGLHSTFYSHFLALLWGDGDSTDVFKSDSSVDSDWEAFKNVVMQICDNQRFDNKEQSKSVPRSSWEFLINSKFHKSYSKYTPGICFEFNLETGFPNSCIEKKQITDTSFYKQILVETLDSLHALYESLKLDNLRKRDLGILVALVYDVAAFLGERNYLDYYLRDFCNLPRKSWVSQSPYSSRTPPSLFRWLESCLQGGCVATNIYDLPCLIHNDRSSAGSWARKVVSFYSLLLGAERSGSKLSSGIKFKIVKGSFHISEELTILAMVAENFGLRQLDLLPAGVSLPLRHALDKCRESPPTDWPAAAYVLIGREDLAFSCLEHSNKSKDPVYSHIGDRLISVSAPYMLHLHAVTIPSISDTKGVDGVKIDDSASPDGSAIDGMEHIFNSSTQLRYGRDLRLNEARRLLSSAKPVSIQTSGNPTASDQDLQQAQLWQLAQRTTALPFGRGAFTLATTCTLLTEALTIPKLVLAGHLPAQQFATVNIDPNIRNMVELTSWPEFHNAVAAGLKLSPMQAKMSRTWIKYNKPEEPNITHAGLLLALGLHGHLRVLTVTDIYQYFFEEHESTTLGLMLGLAASYKGTMETAISKTLYFHIPSRHPASFPELELPTLLQSAALMAIGILYEGSAHPETMQVLLGEMGRRSVGDNVLEREGYALSAGSALGLVALGRGESALGFMDTLVDRLFQLMGGKDFYNERSFIVSSSTDDQNRGVGQMMEGTPVNADVTAPGAIIALALMFLKTESKAIADRLSIPHTYFDLQYVRPDFIMLRIITRNLIMWSRVHPSVEWIQSQIPEIVKKGVTDLGCETVDSDDLEAETLVQAYVNIVAGTCISLGLRYAGTRNDDAQKVLYNYAIYFLNEIKPISIKCANSFPKRLSKYVDRGTIEICLHLIALSLCVVMAGSGHLKTFRLLRYLRKRTSADGHAIYGTQMAVSLAIGFLFLGGGVRTFSTGNSAIASLLFTLYPRLPTGPNDNRCHLQAFRHLYVLSSEARWVQTVDVDTGLPVFAPLEVTITETDHYAETSFSEVTPCILPERAVLKTVRVCGPRYWPQVIELLPEDKPWWSSGEKGNPFNGGILYIKRKVGSCSYVDDPVGCQSLFSRAMHKACDFGSTSGSTRDSSSQQGLLKVDQLISTFSSDPSLIAFAQLCCDPSGINRSDVVFQEFCLQVLLECVSKDRPALLQVYLSLYIAISSMAEQVTSGTLVFGDSIFLSSLKVALAYNKAFMSGRLSSSRGGIVQSIFMASIEKRVEDILNHSGVKADVHNYLSKGDWPHESSGKAECSVLSWYLKWFEMPHPLAVDSVLTKIKLNQRLKMSSCIPLLHLMLPRTHINAISEIDKLRLSSQAVS